ncbi:MAG: nucleotidyltransferase, partial [Lysobacteraceae bacterium]
MATTVNSAFDQLATSLIPSTFDVNAVRSHRASIETRLYESFGVSNFFGTGSSENSTDVAHYSDVDYFASIPALQQRDNSAYMLTVMRDDLAKRFWSTNVRVSTPAVVLEFGTNGSEKVEVTPAYYTGRDAVNDYNVYKIPTTGGGWIKSSPSVHNKYVTEQNVRLNSKLKPLIRLIKAIAYYNNIGISSFYIELRIAKWAESEKTIIYPIDVRTMLRHF